jgi:hypothetical protein
MRHVDIASKASFTALRASSDSPMADIASKLRAGGSACFLCMKYSSHPIARRPAEGPG